MCSTLSMMIGGTDVAVLSIMLYRSRMAEMIEIICSPVDMVTKGLCKVLKKSNG